MIKRKLKDRRGFSLAETLLAVLILLLVSLIVANGVPAAVAAYEKVSLGANAKVLLSTTISALRDELATATSVEVTDATTVTYYGADKGAASEISIEETDGIPVIKLKEYASADPTDFEGETAIYGTTVIKDRNLVSAKAATNDLFVTYQSISYVPGNESITINGLRVAWAASKDAELAKVDQLTIRFIKRTEADS